MPCNDSSGLPLLGSCCVAPGFVTARIVTAVLDWHGIGFPYDSLEYASARLQDAYEKCAAADYPVPTPGKEQMVTWALCNGIYVEPKEPPFPISHWEYTVYEGRCTGAGFFQDQMPTSDNIENFGSWNYSFNGQFIVVRKTRLICPSRRKICLSHMHGRYLLAGAYQCGTTQAQYDEPLERIEAEILDVELRATPFLRNDYDPQGEAIKATVGSPSAYPAPCSNAP